MSPQARLESASEDCETDEKGEQRMYTLSQYMDDKEVLSIVEKELSRLACGEGSGELRVHFQALREIVDVAYGKWSQPLWNSCMNMMVTVCGQNSINGFQCKEFAFQLDELKRRLKDIKPPFRKRTGKKCLNPDWHPKGCACGNLSRFMEGQVNL